MTSIAETICWVSSATCSRSSDPGTPVTIIDPRSIRGPSSASASSQVDLVDVPRAVERQSASSNASTSKLVLGSTAASSVPARRSSSSASAGSGSASTDVLLQLGRRYDASCPVGRSSDLTGHGHDGLLLDRPAAALIRLSSAQYSARSIRIRQFPGPTRAARAPGRRWPRLTGWMTSWAIRSPRANAHRVAPVGVQQTDLDLPAIARIDGARRVDDASSRAGRRGRNADGRRRRNRPAARSRSRSRPAGARPAPSEVLGLRRSAPASPGWA